MPVPKIDLVTVFFSLEIPFLEVQALSVDRCFDPELVNKIIVVVNEPSLAQEDEAVRRFDAIRPKYGQFTDRVLLVRASQLGELSEKGWLTQQACKLAVAKYCKSEYFVVLDAKHHAIRPVRPGMLFDDHGVPTKAFTKTRQDQRPWLDASFSYFDQPNLIPSYRCPSSAPPFPINAKVCAEMADYIERREGVDLLTFFVRKQDVSTEFTLYIAYIAKRGLLSRCITNGPATYVSLRGKIDRARIAGTKSKFEDPNVWCFSAHRRAFRDVRDRTLRTIAEGWSLFLFPSYDEAYASVRLLADELSGVKDFHDLREVELKK